MSAVGDVEEAVIAAAQAGEITWAQAERALDAVTVVIVGTCTFCGGGLAVKPCGLKDVYECVEDGCRRLWPYAIGYQPRGWDVGEADEVLADLTARHARRRT